MKPENVTIGGVQYTVEPLTVRDVMPCFEQGGDAKNLGFEMFKKSVCRDGRPIGDGALDLGIADFNKLYEVVNRVNGESGNE